MGVGNPHPTAIEVWGFLSLSLLKILSAPHKINAFRVLRNYIFCFLTGICITIFQVVTFLLYFEYWYDTLTDRLRIKKQSYLYPNRYQTNKKNLSVLSVRLKTFWLYILSQKGAMIYCFHETF